MSQGDFLWGLIQWLLWAIAIVGIAILFVVALIAAIVADARSRKRQKREKRCQNRHPNYASLETLLSQKRWREADHETCRLIAWIMDAEQIVGVSHGEMFCLPCEALHTIDELWIKYSNNRFGLTLKKEIFLGLLPENAYPCEQTFMAYSEAVGWSVNDQWLPYESLTFSEDAPKGHLPTAQCMFQIPPHSGINRFKVFSALMQKLERCEQTHSVQF